MKMPIITTQNRLKITDYLNANKIEQEIKEFSLMLFNIIDISLSHDKNYFTIYTDDDLIFDCINLKNNNKVSLDINSDRCVLMKVPYLSTIDTIEDFTISNKITESEQKIIKDALLWLNT
jgi:hypothetical protein